jgi:hypothetical protein
MLDNNNFVIYINIKIKEKYMALNTIIGQAARGNNYFPRPAITKQIWERIETGANLLLVAPRRVGKSSILFNLLDHPQEKQDCNIFS